MMQQYVCDTYKMIHMSHSTSSFRYPRAPIHMEFCHHNCLCITGTCKQWGRSQHRANYLLKKQKTEQTTYSKKSTQSLSQHRTNSLLHTEQTPYSKKSLSHEVNTEQTLYSKKSLSYSNQLPLLDVLQLLEPSPHFFLYNLSINSLPAKE